MRRCFRAVLSLSLMASPFVVRGQAPDSPRELEGKQRLNGRPEASCADVAAPLREPIRVGSNVQRSKFRSSVQPVYPPGSEGAGKIVLLVTINEEGAVYSIRFPRCPASLKAAVRAAVCQWRYDPTYLQEEPVPVEEEPVPVTAVVVLSYNFARYRI